MSRRILALTGVAFAVLFALGFILGSGDDTSSSQAEISYYVGHQSQIHLAFILLAIAVVLLTFFIAYLHSAIRDGGDGSPPLAAAVLVGGAIWGTGLLINAMTHDAFLQAALHGQASAAGALQVLGAEDFFPMVGGIAVTLLAAGIASARGAGLPAWLGWSAIVIGVLALAGPLGMIAFLAAPVWVLIAAIVLAAGGVPVKAGVMAAARA